MRLVAGFSEEELSAKEPIGERSLGGKTASNLLWLSKKSRAPQKVAAAEVAAVVRKRRMLGEATAGVLVGNNLRGVRYKLGSGTAAAGVATFFNKVARAVATEASAKLSAETAVPAWRSLSSLAMTGSAAGGAGFVAAGAGVEAVAELGGMTLGAGVD